MSLFGVINSRLMVVPSQLTAMTFVGRAVLAGLLGGVLAAVLLATVGERSIQAAIALEESRSLQEDETVRQAEISRDVQIAGGLTAVVLFGVLNGVVFGTALAALRHRLGLADDFQRSVTLAGAAFISVALFPAVKYPANPPGVGDPSTIDQRTGAYLSLVAASLALTVGCGQVYRYLRPRLNQSSAITTTIVVAVGGFVLLGLLWPANPDQIPEGFPANLLWEFRLTSLASLSVQWATLGLATGWLLCREADPNR